MTRSIHTVTELRECAARRASGDMSETEFRSQFSALLSRVPPRTILESAFFSLPANRPPWFDTGLTCRAGEEVTVFAAGRAYLSREWAEALQSRGADRSGRGAACRSGWRVTHDGEVEE
jgi:hypothetical protein